MFLWKAVRQPTSLYRPISRKRRPKYNVYATIVRRARLISTSSPGAAVKPTVELVQQFRDRVWHAITSPDDLSRVHEAYTALRGAIFTSEDAQTEAKDQRILSKADFSDALDVLASSGEQGDLTLAQQILGDVPALFGESAVPELELATIKNLVRRGDVQAVFNWIESMEHPDLSHWHLFFDVCSKQGEIDAMWVAIKRMSNSESPPTNETFKFILRGLFQSSVPSSAKVLNVVDQLQQARLPFDPSLLSLMVDGFTSRGLLVQANRLETIYQSRIGQRKHTAPAAERGRNYRLAKCYRTEGKQFATHLFNSLRQRGFKPHHDTLLAIISASFALEDLPYWEETLGVEANHDVWTGLIKNSLASKRPHWRTLKIYAQAKEVGIRPDVTLAGPLIRALCATYVRPPTAEAIDQALELYRDINIPSSQASGEAEGTAEAAAQWLTIHYTLIRALIASPAKEKHFKIAVELLEDMCRRKEPMDSTTATSLTTLLMRAASDFNEAFIFYTFMRDYDEAPLDAHGYATILHTFSDLQFDNKTIPPWDKYFQILKDMRTAGHPYTPHVYTSVLRQMARIATGLSPDDPGDFEAYRKLILSIRQLHHFLTLDASLTPDTALWNQLMDTYQRSLCYQDAQRIWDMLYLSRAIDHTSISIIFDAYGFAGASKAAFRLFEKLHEDGYRLNLRNWHAWLECLCRSGQFGEAVRQLCVEMGKGVDDVAPDEDSVRIILKFARHYPARVVADVRSRIQAHLPGLWKTLPDHLRH